MEKISAFQLFKQNCYCDHKTSEWTIRTASIHVTNSHKFTINQSKPQGLGLPSLPVPPVFPSKILCLFLISPVPATCVGHLPRLDLYRWVTPPCVCGFIQSLDKHIHFDTDVSFTTCFETSTRLSIYFLWSWQ